MAISAHSLTSAADLGLTAHLVQTVAPRLLSHLFLLLRQERQALALRLGAEELSGATTAAREVGMSIY